MKVNVIDDSLAPLTLSHSGGFRRDREFQRDLSSYRLYTEKWIGGPS